MSSSCIKISLNNAFAIFDLPILTFSSNIFIKSFFLAACSGCSAISSGDLTLIKAKSNCHDLRNFDKF